MIASKASCSLSYRIGDLWRRSRYCRECWEIDLRSFEMGMRSVGMGRRRVERDGRRVGRGRRRERVEYKPC